jgi:hypothetical protein
VVVVETVVVVVVTLAQPAVVHASQQLATLPAHACPPLGALHVVALGFTVHRVLPFALVRQHVTLPGFFSQVDLVAHFTIGALHAAGRVPFFTAALT